MAKEYVIGRMAASAVKVPLDKDGVSGRHAMISINDDDVWMLQDLDSTNGTYVRDGDGEFHRIYSKCISEKDVVRLGGGGAGSFVFVAHRVTDDSDSYAYEFRQLRKLLVAQRAAETSLERRNELYGWLSKLSGLAAIGLCAGLDALCGINIDAYTRYFLIACAPVAVGLAFAGRSKSMKKLRKKREKILVCPKCGKPLSEYDIEDGQCSRCKAR